MFKMIFRSNKSTCSKTTLNGHTRDLGLGQPRRAQKTMAARWIYALAAPLTLMAASAPDGARWWSYVEFLASDKLEGRNTGSEGHRNAAQNVSAEIKRDG